MRPKERENQMTHNREIVDVIMETPVDPKHPYHQSLIDTNKENYIEGVILDYQANHPHITDKWEW